MNKRKKSSTLAEAFSKHLTATWDLTPQHTIFLETALHLFHIGIVAVPLCPMRLRSLAALFDTQDIQYEIESTIELLEAAPLIWPQSWLSESPDTLSTQQTPPFVMSQLDGIFYLYPQKLLKLESQIASAASFLFDRSKAALVQQGENGLPQEVVEIVEKCRNGLKKEQHQALICSLSLPFTIMTGGPGTGKSFTAAKIIEAHQLLQKTRGDFCHVLVAAPTGKAVTELQKRLSHIENCSLEYTTLHRLLKMTPSEGSQFKKPFFDASLLVIDECSMIDMEIFALLLTKLHPKTALVLIGDPDQLPPVGTGDVFTSLCHHAKEIHFNGFVSLEESIRFENQKLKDIALLCQRQDPALIEMLQAHQWLTPLSEPSGINRWRVLDMLYWNWRKKATLHDATSPQEALNALKSSIVLCSMREGPWGVNKINTYFLEKALASQSRFIPILFTRNDERLQFQNGSLGILEIDQKLMGYSSQKRSRLLPKGIIFYETASGIRTLFSEEISSFELCFTTSVHKSQGSEFNHVCLVLSPGSEQFGKALLYTAATRAKQTLHFFSFEETLIKTLLFPSGNLSHLHDRLRLKPSCKKEVIADEKIPSLIDDTFAVP